MVIVPEIKTVVILVPRTGSRSLKNALQRHYPGSMQIYRHMEADGIPAGYEKWRKVGVVRDPVDRLWSLYKFMREGRYFRPTNAEMARTRESASMDFGEWLLRNEFVFATPTADTDRSLYFPEYNVFHPIPENRKSQYVYLRPDLGTEVFTFDELPKLAAELNVELEVQNHTEKRERSCMSSECWHHVYEHFQWDLEQTS